MAKKSKRHPLRYDKDQAGCIWGFISFFDFRHGKISRRLLSDRSLFTRQVAGAGCSSPTQYIPANSNGNDIHDGEERDVLIAETSRISVKELMEGEMVIEKDCKDRVTNGDIKIGESELMHKERIKKKRRRKKKASKSFGDIQSEVNVSHEFGAQSSSQHNSEDITFRKADLELVAKDICQQIHQKGTTIMKDDSDNEIDSLIEQKSDVVDKKLSEAIGLFVDRRAKDGKIDHSEEFMDALATLNSNKELILELLKDPNSVLVKHIEKLEASRLEKDQGENSIGKSKLIDVELNTNIKKRQNFFWRRSKSEEKIRFSGDDNGQSSNRIVILKPGIAFQSPDVLANGVRNERVGSHFSFTEIKRRLKNAMGKEKNGLPTNGTAYKIACERQNSGNSEKGFGGEKVGWNSPNRNHFYMEKFARPANGIRNKDTLFKPKSSETSMGNESLENNEKTISNIYIEAKRHISEKWSEGDEIGVLSNRPLPKALGKMLSVPGYNFSPVNSPRENEHHITTAKQRLTPLSSFHIAYENTSKLSPEKDIKLCDNNSELLDELNRTSVEGETLSSERSEKNSADLAIDQTTNGTNEMEIVQKTDDLLMEEGKVLDVPAEECSSSAIEDNQGGELVQACDEEEKLESLAHEPILSSPSTSPPSSSEAKLIGDVDTAKEKLERPSPVSVLEPLFSEDDISPAGIKFQPVEPSMRPLKIQFVEQLSSVSNQDLYASACLDDEESAFEYVEAVLLASDLNINEFRQRWLSSNSILDPSLFNEVELFSSRSSQDQKLLFDCTNEVLNEVFDGYFGYFPRVWFVKHNIRPIPRGMDLIREIWNEVEWHFVEEHSPRFLDHIVRKDLKKDGKWMDLRFDVEGIGLEIGDSVFKELVEDILSSFQNEEKDTGSSMLQKTCIEIE